MTESITVWYKGLAMSVSKEVAKRLSILNHYTIYSEDEFWKIYRENLLSIFPTSPPVTIPSEEGMARWEEFCKALQDAFNNLPRNRDKDIELRGIDCTIVSPPQYIEFPRPKG